MKIEINASLFGFTPHEEIIEIEEWEIRGMTEEEIEDFIDRTVWEHARNSIEYDWTIKE